MPTQKTEFVFDKNNFLSELLNNTILANYINETIDALGRPHNRDKDGNVYGYNGPMDDSKLESVIKNNPDREHITKSLYAMYKNPDGQVATELKSFWNFVGPVFCSDHAIFEQQYLVVLKGINTFNTENQVKLLRYMFGDIDHNPNIRINIPEEKQRQLRKNIAIMMASNPDATLEDMTDAASVTGDMKIVIDTVEMAKRELDKEKKKEYMDVNAISQICNCAHRTVGSISHQDHKYADAIKQIFTIDTILAADAKYVQKVNESYEKRAIDAEYNLFLKDNEIEKQKKETENAKQKTVSVEQKLETEQQKNAKLVQQLNEQQQKINKLESIIRTIKMKIGSLKANFFAGGGLIKEVQNYVNDITKGY